MRQVIICGLGAVGITFGCKLRETGANEACSLDSGLSACNLKILADEKRIEKYKLNKPVFNGVEQDFEYILPTDCFDADLIIICTKAQGLESAIQMIKNFVSEKTRIISLINGISSEGEILRAYPNAEVLKSYFIGHSAVRDGNSTTQDGVGEIVTEKDEVLEEIFKSAGINYSTPDNIDYTMWLKFTLNIFSNQTSAILKLNFGEMKHNKHFMDFARKIINEVRLIAEEHGVQGLENLEKDAFEKFNKMRDDGKTSMFQDVLAKRPTEVDIFAGEIIRLGKKYNIPTPYNQVLYDLIKIEEERNEHSIHTC